MIIIENGTKFNLLTVEDYEGIKRGRAYYACKCDCGNLTSVSGTSLRQGKVKSCGCLRKKKKYKGFDLDDKSDRKLYRTWNDMKRRCEQPNRDDYERYGGAGITVCEEWQNFQNFHDWSKANGYEPHLTIDRIDSTKGYSPDNCRWADYITQANNRKSNHLMTYEGETKTMAEWCKELNLPYSTIRARLRRGWTDKMALSKPIRQVMQIDSELR